MSPGCNLLLKSVSIRSPLLLQEWLTVYVDHDWSWGGFSCAFENLLRDYDVEKQAILTFTRVPVSQYGLVEGQARVFLDGRAIWDDPLCHIWQHPRECLSHPSRLCLRADALIQACLYGRAIDSWECRCSEAQIAHRRCSKTDIGEVIISPGLLRGVSLRNTRSMDEHAHVKVSGAVELVPKVDNRELRCRDGCQQPEWEDR